MAPTKQQPATQRAEPPGGPLVMTVPLWFVWTAIAVGLPAVALLLLLAAPRLAAANFANPAIFALTHAATLGWGSMTIFGAAYQMSQSLLGQRLQGERWIPWQFGVFAGGTTALVTGFLTGRLELLVVGGSGVTAAAWLFFLIMMRTARQLRRRAGTSVAASAPADGVSPFPDAASRKTPGPGHPRVAGGAGMEAGAGRTEGSGPAASRVTGAHKESPGRSRGRWVHGLTMALATFSFALLTAWGVLLALSLRYPFWPQLHVDWRGLVVHVALGFGGWFALMVMGVSYRLIPVIHGTRPVGERRALSVTLLVISSVALTVAGALAGWLWARRLAALLAAPAAVLYAVEVLDLLRLRRRRAPDLNVDHWVAVLLYGLVLAAMGVAWAAGLPAVRLAGARPAVAAAVLFLGGWVTQAILGQLYKVTPCLMWHYRSFVPDVVAIPNLPDLYAPRAGRFVLWATNVGVVALAAAVWQSSPQLARAGAGLFLAGALVASWLFGYSWVPAVLRGQLPFVWRRR